MEENTEHGRKKSSNFLVQGSIYAVSAIISSIIGLLYRLPLTRIIGDDGIGYYSAAFNVYTIILLLSSYSLPLAVSKMISARISKGSYINARRILNASILYATVVGGAGFCIIWFGAGWFASFFLKMPESVYALKALAPTVWIVSYLGVMRGYYQGYSTMVPTSVSQVIEQLVNAVVSVGAAWFLLHYAMRAGMNPKNVYGYGAMGGTIGTGAGAFSALLMFLILFICGRKYFKKRVKEDRSIHTESYREISGILFMTVVPVILSTAVYNVSGIIDTSIFGNTMASMGLASKTAGDFGIYSGKYKVLINVPIAIANALSSSLIPTLSGANAARDKGQVESSISKAIRFSMIVAIPAAVGLAVLAEPIISLLFGAGSSERAVLMMHVGSIAVILYSLSTVSNAILQGTSHMRVPLRHAVISLLIHICALLICLNIFHLGIFGVVFADIVFALCMCLFNAASIRKILTYRQEIKRTFLLPALCASIMGAAAYFLYRFITRILYRFGFRILAGTVLSILAAILIYGSLLIRTGCITEYDLTFFPGGKKLVRAARRLHLLT